MGYTYIPAKPISYGGTRAVSSVKYIVIHYTAGNGDTAIAECNYFKNGNTRAAGAHFFVDQSGACYQSISLDRTAWSVGGFYTKANGAGSYYNVCTNSNSVSIELCDNLNKDPSAKQIAATKALVAFIRSHCVNAKTIIRHWDVNGKACPARMIGTNNAKWNNFKAAISGGVAPKPTPAPTPAPSNLNKSTKWIGEVTTNGLNVRTGAGTNYGKLSAWPQLGKGNVVGVCDSRKASDGGTWYYIIIAEKYYGWVNSNYIKKKGSSPAPAPKPSGYKVWVGKVTASTLNVRTGAGTSYGKLKAYPQLGKNNLVDVIGEAKAKDGSTWYKIRIANKHVGYVHSAYLKKA